MAPTAWADRLLTCPEPQVLGRHGKEHPASQRQASFREAFSADPAFVKTEGAA